MEKNRKKGRGSNGGPELFHLLLIQKGIIPSPWVSGEELYGLAAPRMGSFGHPGEASCYRNMKTESHRQPLKKHELEVKIKYVIFALIVNKKLKKKCDFSLDKNEHLV